MRFRYLKDPLFLFCLALYFFNRWVLKPHFPNIISQDYLNDLICIPFWVPIMLFLMRKTGLRRNDLPPQGYEILVPLLLWSWVFEQYLPHTALFKRLAFSDHMDILSYAMGACVAALIWRFQYREHPRQNCPRAHPQASPADRSTVVRSSTNSAGASRLHQKSCVAPFLRRQL